MGEMPVIPLLVTIAEVPVWLQILGWACGIVGLAGFATLFAFFGPGGN